MISSAITAGLALWAKFSTGFMEELEDGAETRGRKLAGLVLKVIDSLPEKLKWKLSNFKYRYYQSLIYIGITKCAPLCGSRRDGV